MKWDLRCLLEYTTIDEWMAELLTRIGHVYEKSFPLIASYAVSVV